MGWSVAWMGEWLTLKESHLHQINKVPPGSVGPEETGFGVKS